MSLNDLKIFTHKCDVLKILFIPEETKWFWHIDLCSLIVFLLELFYISAFNCCTFWSSRKFTSAERWQQKSLATKTKLESRSDNLVSLPPIKRLTSGRLHHPVPWGQGTEVRVVIYLFAFLFVFILSVINCFQLLITCLVYLIMFEVALPFDIYNSSKFWWLDEGLPWWTILTR